MKRTLPHLKTLEEIERECIPGLVEVLRWEGIEGVWYTLWDMTNWTLYLLMVQPVQPSTYLADVQ